nr:hypothetical protein Iba_chr15cCG1460 [Ipomoea batatas]
MSCGREIEGGQVVGRRERRNGEEGRRGIDVAGLDGGGGEGGRGIRVWEGVEEAEAGICDYFLRREEGCGGRRGEMWGDDARPRRRVVETRAVTAVDVHVAAEGLGGAKLPPAKSARVRPRRPRGIIPRVLSKSPNFPRILILRRRGVVLHIPHPIPGGGAGTRRRWWLQLRFNQILKLMRHGEKTKLSSHDVMSFKEPEELDDGVVEVEMVNDELDKYREVTPLDFGLLVGPFAASDGDNGCLFGL